MTRRSRFGREFQARPSRSGIRHDDGPIPDDLTLRTRRDRERISRVIAWAAIAAVVVAFGQGFI